jgi:hypothetical protein
MNLFLLDLNPIKSAMYQCDKHVVKMTLETAQMLCTAHWLCDAEIGEGWYKPTHTAHPMVRWVAHSSIAYKFAYAQFCALAGEYEYRYGREHLSWYKLGEVLETPPLYASDQSVGWFPLCMPSVYWPGTVQQVGFDKALSAYRAYYRGEKQRMFTWTGRQVPNWLRN